mmetsp:Transcript_30812/g.67646  ORF Transcript_30812/g.67646 Transcript_30812/m.67646 type:complete len:123 (-) Transcript_30812:230-598(-)
MTLFSCCRGCEDGVVAPQSGSKRDLLVSVVNDETKTVEPSKQSTKNSPADVGLDDTVDEFDVPDLDDLENSNDGANSSSTNGMYAFAEEDRGVTVMIFNFLMVFLGLGRLANKSKQKAITSK